MTTIRTNTLSLRGFENARRSESALSLAIQRLSSGLRINSAKDDAAGQAIGNRMTSMILGQAAAARNANDGISMMATAEGALSSINDRLQRIRVLTVQGLNGSLNQGDRDAIQAEINLNLKEIDRLTQQTQFNGKHLLDGSAGALNLQVGAFDGQTLVTDFGGPGFGVDALGLKDYTISGIAGDIHDIGELPGRAINVMLAAPDTTVGYWLNGSAMPADTKLMRRGLGDYFVQTTKDGQIEHYLANYQSNSATADHSSRVDVTAQSNTSFKESNQVADVTLDAGTTIQYLDGSGLPITAGSPMLVKADSPTDGNLYYLRMDQGGETFYYRATITGTKSRDDGPADGVTVKIDGASPRFSTQDYGAATVLQPALPAAGGWQDAGGAVLDAATLQAVFDGDAGLNSGRTLIDAHRTGLFQGSDGHYYVGVEYQVADAVTSVQSLETRYYAAEIGTSDPAGGAPLVTIKADTSNGVVFNTGDVTSQAMAPEILPGAPGVLLSSADAGLAALVAGGHTLVQGADDHRYYLTDGTTYTAVDVAQAVVRSDGTVSLEISANTQTAQARQRAAFNMAVAQSGLTIPGLSPAAPGSFDVGGKTFVKYDVDGISGNDQYFLRELSGDNVKFYKASVQVQMASDGTVSLAGVTADPVATYDISDVQKVSGDALVSLGVPPPDNNVVVTYVDHTGKTYHDVLTVDPDGHYILDLPDYAGGGTSRTATLVQVDNLADHLISQDGDLLIKTLNGTGEVVIYYALGYTANTDANDRDGNGNYHTELTITEMGNEIRLRTPRYPLAALDRAMALVDGKRSELGAVQNRLESAIRNLDNSNMQLSAARSRIEDADYAVEVSNMTRAQILQQASIAVLAQANQVPQTMLSLLR